MNMRIRKLRKYLGFSMEEFGSRIGLTKSMVSRMESGSNKLTARTIQSICREFDVNEKWLQTGEGEMFLKPSREDEITEAVNRLLSGEQESFRSRLILALSNLEESQWSIVEEFIRTLIKEKEQQPKPNMIDAEIEADVERYRRERYARRDANDMEVTSELTPSPDKELDVMSELAEIKRQNQEMKRQNQEMAQQNREVVRQNEELLTRLEILEKEEYEWEREHTKQNISPTRSHTQ